MNVLAWVAIAWGDPAPDPVSAVVPTADGHHVVLHRRPRPGAPPVVLCHGISSNHHFWDLQPDRSLALALHDAGYDVWNLDLRGHGAATDQPDRDWTIDDYGLQDLPAALAHITEVTGQPQAHFVGHSLGGMVLAIYLSQTEAPGIDRAVVVGSPLGFRDADAILTTLLGLAKSAPGRLPTVAGGRLLGWTRRAWPGRMDEALYNPTNLTGAAEGRMLRHGVSPLYSGEIDQLAQTRHDGTFRSADGTISYRDALQHVTVPMLFVAGRGDRVVSPDWVRTYHDAVGSTDKAFVVASIANGMHADYGHLDLGCGDHAATDVFPVILDWLQRP